MKRAGGPIRLVIVLMLSSLILSGCFLRTMFGGFGTFPERQLIVTLEMDANSATCVQKRVGEGRETTIECTYWIISDEGFIFDVVSTADLVSEFGWFGVLVDPLILQVPNDWSEATGTYRYFDTDQGEWVGPLPLVVTGVDTFRADASTTVEAESGNSFLIFELPDDEVAKIPEGDARLGTHFFFELEFALDTARDIEIKPMSTGRIDIGGDTFYIPLAPCVTDFAEIPAITLTHGEAANLYPQFVDAFLQTMAAGTHVCDGVVYDLDNGVIDPPPPANGDTAIINVKPDSDVNPINPRSKGVVPVAVLTTSTDDGDAFDFDAGDVNPTTLRFGPGEAHVAHDGYHLEDVDGDGDLDLVVHFWTQESGISCGDETVSVTGMTFDGGEFEGEDTIRTVGCR
jgi:hypothetical protein